MDLAVRFRVDGAQLVLGSLVRVLGARVELFVSGREELDFLKSSHFRGADLVLLDVGTEPPRALEIRRRLLEEPEALQAEPAGEVGPVVVWLELEYDREVVDRDFV